ncbi:MAG: MAPEG family protein [Proteobacteria bacterium]|nr:MAPEG family protein [Pseudomonadota bacterium]
MELIVIIMMLALVEYIVLGVRVGLARGRTGVQAPAVTGNEEFERHFRVHYNTLEQLVIFLPAIWFFAQYVHLLTAAGLGVVFLVGRIIYAVSYVRDPASRSAGVLLTILPAYVMTLGAMLGAAWHLLQGRM